VGFQPLALRRTEHDLAADFFSKCERILMVAMQSTSADSPAKPFFTQVREGPSAYRSRADHVDDHAKVP